MTNSLQSPPVSKQEAAAELLRRRRARQNLLEFTRYTMPAYQVGWHHAALCAKLDAFAHGQIRRLMVFMPPQHGKSELVSRRLPAYLLGRHPNARVIACSYTADLAGTMNRDVQRVMDADSYRALFPGVNLPGKRVKTLSGAALRNSDEFEIIDRDGRLTGGSYKSAGVLGGITGRPMDFGVIDDPIKGREQADSAAHRENVWGWYNGDFLSRTHGKTQLLLTCTRWHEDDLAGRLLKVATDEPKADQWEVVCYPAILEQPTAGDPRQVGEPLWPERHPLESLEAKRASSPYDWASLYQGHPRAQGSTEWPDELFPASMWFDDWPPNLQHRVLSLDPSKGKQDKSGDYSAFILLGLDPDWTLWVDADIARRPVEAKNERSIVSDGLELAKAWRPEAFSVETNGFQEMVATAILRESEQQHLHLPMYAINNTVPKVIRIRQLGTYLAQKRLRVRSTPGGRMLVQMMKDFPCGSYDDGPDALAQAVVMMDYLIGGQSASGPQLLRV